MKFFCLVFLFTWHVIFAQNEGGISPIEIETSPQLKIYKKTFPAMGTLFEISVVTQREETAKKSIKSAQLEIIRIEGLISSWDQNSQTTAINNQAGIQPVKVDQELFELIQRSLKISEQTCGAFDISFASLEPLWKFDGSMKNIPEKKAINNSVKNINYKNIILNQQKTTAFLKNKGMKIGFGAIGKGYAADRAKQVLVKLGIQSGLVNAGGDLIAWGIKPNGEYWKIGIADPQNKNEVMKHILLNNCAIVTSGDAERFVLIEGKKYGHIIDPRTGYPAAGLKSVSVRSTSAELADAMATAIFVLGKRKGLKLINKLMDSECFIIDDQNRVYSSKNIGSNGFVNWAHPFEKN